MARSLFCVKSGAGVSPVPTWNIGLPTKGIYICTLRENYEPCHATGHGEAEQDDRTYAIGVMTDPPMPAIDAEGRKRRKSTVALERATTRSACPVVEDPIAARI